MLLIIGNPPGLNRRIVSPRIEKLLKAGKSGVSPGSALTTSILPLPVRSCFFNLSAPAHSSGTYKPPLLPRKPEPPDLISLEQRQPPQPPVPPDPPDPPLVASTATLVTAASSVTFVTAASLLGASGIIEPAVSLCSNATLHSDDRHLRSTLSPSSLSAANKLLRSGGADVSPGFFSVWAWPMNQDEVLSPYPHLLTSTLRLSNNARSHIFILKEVYDWLLRFSLITTRWSCHGNVEVRRFGQIRTSAPSPYLIILSVFRRMKLSLSCLPYSVKPKLVTKEVIVLILMGLVQILAIESLSHLFLRVHIAQFQSCSHSAYQPPLVFLNGKLSQLGLRCLESFISSPFIAEAIVIRSALCMALTLEFSTLKVLSDSLTLIRAISGDLQSKEIIGFVYDIQSISSGFAACSLYHVSRSDNLVADVLAKKLFKLISLCNGHLDLGHRFEHKSSS
uniref:RNase H type-1 domain-containing protein n=1 Tax=Brassica campestris TaxID=3711 RepID=M4FJ63_BRACM